MYLFVIWREVENMNNAIDYKLLSKRLVRLRAELVKSFPFFGRLLLHLQLGFAECTTAYTDMKRIVFDPEFASRLSDEELKFVFLHECYHCVLKHCIRGKEKGLQHRLHNIACDIVINSYILQTLGLKEFVVDNVVAMHLAPDGVEGREYSAEQIYYMLLKDTPEEEQQYEDCLIDNHEPWLGINASLSEEMWDKHIKMAIKTCEREGNIPGRLLRALKEMSYHSKIDWKRILHDFIQRDRADYVYDIPDKRFSGDLIMPSYQECVDGNKVDHVWCLIDTSGSINNEALMMAMGEIKEAIEQIGMSGLVSFFDTEVTEPANFEVVEDLYKAQPKGGGGTSFYVIFEYLEKMKIEELPRLMIILTDGYATFPKEEAALGIPVLWVIIGSKAQPDFGECIYI